MGAQLFIVKQGISSEQEHPHTHTVHGQDAQSVGINVRKDTMVTSRSAAGALPPAPQSQALVITPHLFACGIRQTLADGLLQHTCSKTGDSRPLTAHDSIPSRTSL